MNKTNLTNSILKQLQVPAVTRVEREDMDDDSEYQSEIPDELPILPLRGLVVYPLTAVPIRVGQPRSVRCANARR